MESTTEALEQTITPLSNGDSTDPNTTLSPRKLEEHLVSGTRHSRRKSATELRRLSHKSKESEEDELEDLRELLELKQYHEYFRDFLTIWKNTLASKSSQLTSEIVDCCNDQKDNETTFTSNAISTNKEEFAKQILFWLSACVARINEPHHILRDFAKLHEAGINGNRLDKILKIILTHLREHKLFDFKINEMYNDICFQLLTFFSPPNCEKCHTQLIVVVPKDVKPSNTHNPFHGFLYREQTRNDCVPVCESCQQRLMLEDVYFQCPQCGPNEIVRVIRGGRLKNVVKNPEGGSTICIECIVRLCVNRASQAQEERNIDSTSPLTNKIDEEEEHENEKSDQV